MHPHWQLGYNVPILRPHSEGYIIPVVCYHHHLVEENLELEVFQLVVGVGLMVVAIEAIEAISAFRRHGW